MNESVTLTRDCKAAQIPSGHCIVLPKGAQVRITQSLGGNYTVLTESGYMVQISGEDADAIGPISSSVEAGLSATQRSSAAPQAKKADPSFGGKPALTESAKDVPLEKQVWDQLRTCYDPEIPVNIVELGLVYECRITPLPEDAQNHRVEIKMTLTAPGCGMGDSIKRDAEAKIVRLPGVKEVNVQLVWEPVWDQSRMSQAAKLHLGIM